MTYRVWLRRGSPSQPKMHRRGHEVRLADLGNAAARETFVTATPHLAIWTRLFRGMIANGRDLRWIGRGPGVGRDARIAYSSLMGRYMARAYLTTEERVRRLVPLDVAKARLVRKGFHIEKASSGFLADWIGWDSDGLVIAEAKGSFDRGVGNWIGPTSTPLMLCTAKKQIRRTLVVGPKGGEVPAKRWAVVSRWGTEENGKDPTIMAWCEDDRRRAGTNRPDALARGDLMALRGILAEADLDGVVTGLGHGRTWENQIVERSFADRSADRTLAIDDWSLGPGLVAAVGPFGPLPLLGAEDLELADRMRERSQEVAFVSLSRNYIDDPYRDHRWSNYGDELRFAEDVIRLERASRQAGLTVVWPRLRQRVELARD